MKRALLCLLLALTMLLAAGCADWEVTEDPLGELSDFYQNENEEPEPEPLTSFTLPYFAGESLDPITATEKVQIAVGALLYEKLFELDDVKLTFQDGAIQAIAKRAIERGTGARGIRAIIESVMMNAMYEVPSDEDAVECIITEAAARGEAEPILVTKNDERREISSDSNAKDEIA